MRLRQELPVFSPIALGDIVRAAGALMRHGDGVRARLGELLKARYAAREVVLTYSGTHALQLAIVTARAGRPADTPIALPAFCCFDVATAAIATGSRVLLYDLEPGTLAPDAHSLDLAFRAGAGIAVIAPLYGIPVDWENVNAIARKHGATLIEDAAQGHGASWNGKPLGSLGEISVISFGRGKGWTGGSGGAFLLRGSSAATPKVPPAPGEIAEVANVAALKLQWLLGRPAVYGIPRSLPGVKLGETHYRQPSEARTIAKTAAAALLHSAHAADLEADHRRRQAASLLAHIGRAAQHVEAPVGGIGGYLRLPLLIAGGMRRFPDVPRTNALGIAPTYPITLRDLEPLRPHLLAHPESLEGARRLVSDLVTMPTHSRMSASAVASLSELFRD